MIKGERTTTVPPCLTGSSATNEQKRAEDYYKTNPAGLPSFTGFAVYSGPTVKQALGEMFSWKCAYCESEFVNHGVHVEHFRPKGRVKLERDGGYQKGYWWLAAKWDNLLPTCIDCNTEATHVLPDGTSKKVGKGDYFPLPTGTPCAPSLGYLHTESPVLIDPSKINPGQYFEFTVASSNRKTYSLVRPKKLDEGGMKRAEVSIDAYALNRHRLVVQRTARLSKLEADLLNWRMQLRMLEKVSDPSERQDFAKEVSARLSEILEFYVNRDKPYSAACAAFVQSWLDMNKLGKPSAMLQAAPYAA